MADGSCNSLLWSKNRRGQNQQYGQLAQKHLQTLQTYMVEHHFSSYTSRVENLYQFEWQNLAQFNITAIRLLMSLIGIDTPTVIASEIKALNQNSQISADERLIIATKAVGADCYLSGIGGCNYLQPELFAKNDIKLKFQSFKHPVYRQMTNDFLPNMSILDLLFNEGQRANSIIQGGIR